MSTFEMILYVGLGVSIWFLIYGVACIVMEKRKNG